MSRTDKTRPYKVQVMEQAVPKHDHSKGECDLPPLSPENIGYPWKTRCRWMPRSWKGIFPRDEDTRFMKVRRNKARYDS